MRKNSVLYTMKGHSDTVTGLTLSPDGSFVLSNSMDNSLRVWDIRPFAPQERCIKMMVGHAHNFEKVHDRICYQVDFLFVILFRSMSSTLELASLLLVGRREQSLCRISRPICLRLGHNVQKDHLQTSWPQRQRQRCRLSSQGAYRYVPFLVE